MGTVDRRGVARRLVAVAEKEGLPMRMIGLGVALGGLIIGKWWVAAVGAALFGLSFVRRARLPAIVQRFADSADTALSMDSGNARGPLPAIGGVQKIAVQTTYTGEDTRGASCGCGG